MWGRAGNLGFEWPSIGGARLVGLKGGVGDLGDPLASRLPPSLLSPQGRRETLVDDLDVKCGPRGLASSRPSVKSTQEVRLGDPEKGPARPRAPAPRPRLSRRGPFLGPTPVPRPPERPRAPPQRLGNRRRPRPQHRQPGRSCVRDQRPARREPGEPRSRQPRPEPPGAGAAGGERLGRRLRGTSPWLHLEAPGWSCSTSLSQCWRNE